MSNWDFSSRPRDWCRVEIYLQGEKRTSILKSLPRGWTSHGFLYHLWASWDRSLGGPSDMCIWLRIILSHGLPLRHSTLWLAFMLPTLRPFNYFFFLHAVRLFSFLGLIKMSAHDFQHSAKGARGPCLFNMVSAVMTVPRTSCKEMD